MSQQTATKDEDLLIISDDSSLEDTNETIEISLEDDDSSSDILSSSDDIISFDDVTFGEEAVQIEESTASDIKVEETKEENSLPEVTLEQEVTQADTPSEDISDFSLDLGTSEEVIDSEAKTETFPETASQTELQEDTLSFAEETSDSNKEPSMDLSSSTQETPSSEKALETSDSGTMNTILSETIAKLESRQQVIATEKDGKSSQVADLEAQIKKLQEEVELHKGEIEELDSESKKISTNISSLEKMKLDDSITKEHNSKRVPKK